MAYGGHTISARITGIGGIGFHLYGHDLVLMADFSKSWAWKNGPSHRSWPQLAQPHSGSTRSWCTASFGGNQDVFGSRWYGRRGGWNLVVREVGHAMHVTDFACRTSWHMMPSTGLAEGHPVEWLPSHEQLDTLKKNSVIVGPERIEA